MLNKLSIFVKSSSKFATANFSIPTKLKQLKILLLEDITNEFGLLALHKDPVSKYKSCLNPNSNAAL